jgi:acetolactate synthase-1/2/3 large subunit
MNGAEATLKTLADCGVAACFANPGTSEMQMVSAFDREQRVRPVLCLFEGVATGAADGYARIAGKPAATLLHLGPGLANGGANLHNARRAYAPVVNIVGDHATAHQALDAPLQSDIESLARPHSTWVKSARTADEAVHLAAEAVAASSGPPGGVATLILPADCAWSEVKEPLRTVAMPFHRYGLPAAGRQIEAAAEAVRQAKRPLVLLGGLACTERGLAAAARLAGGKARVMTDTFVARIPRGAGRFAPERMPYFGEMALADLAGTDLMVLVSTKAPAAFFAYPAMPGLLVPEGCAVLSLAALHEDGPAALDALADALGANAPAPAQPFHVPDRPAGELTAYAIGAAIARWAPEEAVICDDGVTSGLPIYTQTRGARPHDWLMLTGGAIGSGMPLAVGAAVAAPGRKVLSLNGDGAAAYTLQALWTMAREGLDVVVVIFANHAYRILSIEMGRTGSGAGGPAAARLLDLGDPRLDWVALAQGFGVSAVRVEEASAFDSALARAVAAPGPHLIEAAMAA